MSQDPFYQDPFGGIQPVELPFSGTTDATGKYVFTTQIRAAFWSIVKVTGLSAGNPTWLLEVGGNPASVGLGRVAELGPFIVGPGEKCVLTITTATPNTAVRGSFNGIQASELQTIAAHFSPSPNTLSLTTAAQQILVDRIDITTNNQFVQHTGLVVPPGTHSMAIVLTSANLANLNLGSIFVVGETSSINYLFATGSSTYPFYGAVLPAIDPTIRFQVQAANPINNAFTAWLIAILDPATVTAIVQNQLSTQLVDNSGTLLEGETDRVGNAAHIFSVSSQNAIAAPWQAPSSVVKVDDAAVALPVTKVAAVGGQYVWLHHVSLYLDAATDGITIQDTLGTVLWRTGVSGTIFEVPFSGVRLALGAGLVLGHLAGTTNLKGKIVYSQAV